MITASPELSLHWHLTANHYPPVSTEWVPACLQALHAMEHEHYDREIAVPNHVTNPTGTTTTEVWRIIEFFGLHDMMSADAYEAWEYTREAWTA